MATLLIFLAWTLAALILYEIGAVVIHSIDRRVPGFQRKLEDKALNTFWRVNGLIFKDR
jgi:hypothetical protein